MGDAAGKRHGRVVTSTQVLQVVLSLAPGGSERLVIELSKRLRARHGMAVCCLDCPGEWAQELAAIGVSVTALGRRSGFVPQLGRRIAEVAASHGASVLHCHHYSPFVYGSLARWWHPAALVFTEHGRLSDGPLSRKRWLANQVFSRFPASVFAVSENLKQHMAAEGFSRSRIGVIHNGIEIDAIPGALRRRRARALLSALDGDLLIGAVGRLDPVKDLPTLLHAFGRLTGRHSHARLILIGDGPERARLERLIAASNLSTRVTLAGYRRDVKDLLPALDVYVNTSVFEGLSLTILEAMAAALPVVATQVGGTPEVVVDGETGILVPNDPEAIAGALSALLHDSERRRMFGRAGRTRVERLFSIDRMIQQYASVYEAFGVGACVA